MTEFEPLLASAIKDLDALEYPVIISPKLDGIRAVNLGTGLLSRKLKAIPNRDIQARFGGPGYEWLDGELICGDPWDKDVYNKTFRAVMSKDADSSGVKYYVFDHVRYFGETFMDRLSKLPSPLPEGCVLVEQIIVGSKEELLEQEQVWLEMGYEGVMIRDPNGRYKHGRSTVKEGILLKLKRFTDAEFKVVGFEERMHNGNEATKDELGRTKRSSHQENKVGRGDLGALILETADGQRFNCGTGFDDAQRREIWDNREGYMGRLAKIKYFAIGVVNLPRFPVFLGWRDPIDMGSPS